MTEFTSKASETRSLYKHFDKQSPYAIAMRNYIMALQTEIIKWSLMALGYQDHLFNITVFDPVKKEVCQLIFLN